MGLLKSKPPAPRFKRPKFLSSLNASIRTLRRNPNFSRLFNTTTTSSSSSQPCSSPHSPGPAPAPLALDPSQPSIFSTLWRPPPSKPNELVPLFSDCVFMASSRTQEYLGFKDPEDKFHPSPDVLDQIFLMTYISQSVKLNLTPVFNCTAMTPQQRVLLGVDWVWAVLEKNSKNPRIQIAVQVLHLQPADSKTSEDDDDGTAFPPEACASESVYMARLESSHRTMCERMVDFCASIGSDCYALFLFFGKKNDGANIYGVLSNNFHAAIGKCDKINRGLIENFFKGSRYLHTPTGMLQSILTKKEGDPLTLLIKFS